MDAAPKMLLYDLSLQRMCFPIGLCNKYLLSRWRLAYYTSYGAISGSSKIETGGKKRLKSRLNSYLRSLVYILLLKAQSEREASIYFVLPDVAPMFMWGLWGLKESIFNNIRVWPTHFQSPFSHQIEAFGVLLT